MNWTIMQTYSLSQAKSFEMIGNQIFENWCKEEYSSEIVSFNVVNGAGGDGGVESYAVLRNGDIVAFQAKFFLSSIDSSKISQIRNSIKTAFKIRSQIKRYIICIPRDLASVTGKGDNTEDKRWEELKDKILKEYPDKCLELWTDSRITSELEKNCNVGVLRFWFQKAELSIEVFRNALENAKSSWLQTKYVPELNTYGEIDHLLELFLGTKELNEKFFKQLSTICKLGYTFLEEANELLTVYKNRDKGIDKIINDTIKDIGKIIDTSERLQKRLINESESIEDLNWSDYRLDYAYLIHMLERDPGSHSLYSHKRNVLNALKQLSQIDLSELYKLIEYTKKQKCILFLGNPGTGKTHGVGAFAEKISVANLHIPLLIQAKNFASDKTWKDIIIDTLGLSNTWSEEELWQGIVGLLNRNRFRADYISEKIKILPKAIIIVDGLDEALNEGTWENRIKEATNISLRYPQIRFCFTARPYIFSHPDNWVMTERIRTSGDVPVFKLFDSYIKYYNISVTNYGWLKNAINTPIALKLFCDINQNKTVDVNNYSEVTIPSLWRKKIELMENEFAAYATVLKKRQLILTAIKEIAYFFANDDSVECDELLKLLSERLACSNEIVDKILQFLENYGVIYSVCNNGTGIDKDTYIYHIGMQGYFDYAVAITLLDEYGEPDRIDFTNHKEMQIDALYALGAICIQKNNYLITHNDSFKNSFSDSIADEIQLYSLLYTNYKNAVLFVEIVKSKMSENAESLVTIVNQLILPLSRQYGHPLGVSLLDDFLNSFDKPADRDILWSISWKPEMGYEGKWYHESEIELSKEVYNLLFDDKYNGLPKIYAWALSSNNNSLRHRYRVALMNWAKNAPEEFFKLFKEFAEVNDPQIRSDIFSILMCCIYTVADNNLIQVAVDWICNNVLSKDKIDKNRDVAIRYYSIAIIKKAIVLGLISDEKAQPFLPPYQSNNHFIKLNDAALKGTRMGGYSAITYDLARYVLIDRIANAFGIPNINEKFKTVIQNVALQNSKYSKIKFEQFIISAAYAFLLDTGWSEKEFNNTIRDDLSNDIIKVGVDNAIKSSYYAATHGEMSKVMTLCEKYIWQAQKYIFGYVCDHLSQNDNEEITDYGLLDDYVIPDQENIVLDEYNYSKKNPLHIPENNKVFYNEEVSDFSDIIKIVKTCQEIEWKPCVIFSNNTRYNINNNELLALYMYSCFTGKSGMERNLYINSIIMNIDDVELFVSEMIELSKSTKFPDRLFDMPSWSGYVDSSCYITPKEICWFPWKKHYNGLNFEMFENLDLTPAVDECTFTIQEQEKSCVLPSSIIRDLLDITDTDGLVYYDKNQKIMAEYILSGELLGTRQEYLLVDKDEIMNELSKRKKTILWIMRSLDKETLKAREKYGNFYAENNRVYIGYLLHGEFYIYKIFESFDKNAK